MPEPRRPLDAAAPPRTARRASLSEVAALRVQAAILAEIRDAIVVTDLDGHITYWNDGATALFGYTAQEMLGRTPSEIYPPDEPDLPSRIGSEFVGDWRGIRKDGSSVWVRLHARPLLDSLGMPIGGIGVATDLTERKRDELERQRLATAVEQSAESIVITDADASIVYVNPAFERATGYASEEVLGANPRILKSGVQSPTFYHAMWAAISNGLPWVADMTNRRKDGTLFQEEAVFTPMTDEDGSITGYVAVKRDVTRQRQTEAEGTAAIRERALIADTLRQLPAGMPAEATGQAVCQQVVNLTGLAHAHLFLFGRDGYATPIGLATYDGTVGSGRRLPLFRSQQLRERSAVGPWIEDWVERPGHPHNKMLRALGIRAAAYVPVPAGGGIAGLLIGGSSDVGATGILSNALPALLDVAEIAGMLLDPAIALNGETDRSRQRVSEMIEARAFSTVFQPILDLGSRRVVGYEALTRFDDRTPPDRFFAEARRLDMERELEIATMRAALAASEALPPGGFLSLNASPDLIAEPTELAELLAVRDRPIVLEVTEHAPIDDYSALRQALLAIGPDIRLAVDDAGAGVANFDHLVGLRPQFIKIDSRLVRGVNTDPARQALTVALLHFASSTDSRIIAEGIETEPELTVLRHLGVELGQGFLLARPAPATELATKRPSDPSVHLRAISGG